MPPKANPRIWLLAALLLLAATIALAHNRITGDVNNTREPAVPAGWAVPRVTSVPADATPGYIAYVTPTDGTNACEGRIAIVEASGVRCLVTEKP